MRERGEIDRQSPRIYKRILQRLTDRYEGFELLVLDELRQGRPVTIAGNMLLLIRNLIDEELVETRGGIARGIVRTSAILVNAQVLLAKKGQKFIEEWLEANKELAY